MAKLLFLLLAASASLLASICNSAIAQHPVQLLPKVEVVRSRTTALVAALGLVKTATPLVIFRQVGLVFI
jgi:hypothetical protein